MNLTGVIDLLRMHAGLRQSNKKMKGHFLPCAGVICLIDLDSEGYEERYFVP